jgi:hypothetical protein
LSSILVFALSGFHRVKNAIWDQTMENLDPVVTKTANSKLVESSAEMLVNIYYLF